MSKVCGSPTRSTRGSNGNNVGVIDPVVVSEARECGVDAERTKRAVSELKVVLANKGEILLRVLIVS